ncbi:hypothetical protein HNQ80_002078 [Anaerosolibacter carboniphilus]|uniref:Uncharacterized protein n=1 Tax=Anaerosolibacter carboniphilus TaxID=1417629 RepID=A0A841KRE1_9FIRM|nr:hypothetical protein [Anaerosolibacter carboniphilus]MBB6215987.1 hypothetical protein [Anaerosolibacter carboniphilus]
MNAIYVEDENEDIMLQESINEDKRAEILIEVSKNKKKGEKT